MHRVSAPFVALKSMNQNRNKRYLRFEVSITKESDFGEFFLPQGIWTLN